MSRVIKPFTSVCYSLALQTRSIGYGKLIHPSPVFESITRTYLSGAPSGSSIERPSLLQVAQDL